ncbi:putative bifunctional diguanylate cyclase/phosphodiesterase [Pseudemcibacter aquimaris]|uniref:putative bifunctional diguanylate cyclase/phosphodiesterase n=1 Tax=Pseudemcibacter aquimaris TaxID=2857064 RepID=UPI00201235E1|nr:bifunctional diguanylate cyclase/phosphodiesterase [Pseudemcibacter aquimaris]MCC3860101.1 bifunctional diguanylate cyclase/phosphodiesterase [Pseudemcibacter aquimaris]WDU57430.1 bifunctional diguanylate cyclase/phosphodiesterase [Pseudemcibacter aquimaris]
MSGQTGTSAFLFRNEKPALSSRKNSFDITSPINDGIAIVGVKDNGIFHLNSANEEFLKLVNNETARPVGDLISNIFWGDDINDDELFRNIQNVYVESSPNAFIWKLKLGGRDTTLICKIIPLLCKDGDVCQMSIITSHYDEEEQLDIEIEQYNHYDPLTRLPNKQKFYENLENAFDDIAAEHPEYSKTSGADAAVLFINVKRLQRVNESYGYEFGDKVLKALSAELKSLVHENAELARFSNDKFVIFLSEVHFENVKREAGNLANSIHHHINNKRLVSGNDIHISVAIGIATGAASSSTIERLMQNAHLAMKKNNGSTSSTQTIIFNQEIQAQAARKIKLETEFREALDRNELELHYQPIVNMQNGLIMGFEGLSRWLNSSRGYISPLEFITIAEETGLIIKLGEWVTATACRDLKGWIDANPLASSLQKAVNVSSSHIISESVTPLVRDNLAQWDLSGQNLKLELTESTIMENSDVAKNILLDLKTLGITLAVDDFGTGYSSLSYLSQIPADSIKIDRAFISKMDKGDEGINMVKVIINLAKSLGMTVVAEGIETEAQCQKLKELGCHYGQGFLFSKAVPADEASDIILNQPFTKYFS